MKTLLIILVLMMVAGGCDCGDCDEIQDCIDEHEAAIDECPDNPADMEPFEWPEDCDAETTSNTSRDYFCEHMGLLMGCREEWRDCGC